MQFPAVSTTQMKNQLAQLQAYELPAAPLAVAAVQAPRMSRRLAASPNTPDAAVIANGVVSFVTGMREQNKADVRNSYLYASLVASKRFPKEDDGAQWYELFATVMSQLGWVFIDKRYSRYSSRDNSLSMDKVGLQTLGALVAGAALPGAIGPALLKVAGSALESLKKPGNDAPISLFNRNANTPGGGQFTLSACAEDDEGEVIMAFGAFHCLSKDSKGSVLFANWSNASTQIYTGDARMVLNPLVYAMARDLVLQRLGQNIESAIANYEI
jgi:hypothetical protein